MIFSVVERSCRNNGRLVFGSEENVKYTLRLERQDALFDFLAAALQNQNMIQQ